MDKVLKLEDVLEIEVPPEKQKELISEDQKIHGEKTENYQSDSSSLDESFQDLSYLDKEQQLTADKTSVSREGNSDGNKPEMTNIQEQESESSVIEEKRNYDTNETQQPRPIDGDRPIVEEHHDTERQQNADAKTSQSDVDCIDRQNSAINNSEDVSEESSACDNPEDSNISGGQTSPYPNQVLNGDVIKTEDGDEKSQEQSLDNRDQTVPCDKAIERENEDETSITTTIPQKAEGDEIKININDDNGRQEQQTTDLNSKEVSEKELLGIVNNTKDLSSESPQQLARADAEEVSKLHRNTQSIDKVNDVNKVSDDVETTITEHFNEKNDTEFESEMSLESQKPKRSGRSVVRKPQNEIITRINKITNAK